VVYSCCILFGAFSLHLEIRNVILAEAATNSPSVYKVQIFFSVKHIQFIVKNTFKATSFGSTEPSSGLFVRTVPYPITSTFEIPSVYNYVICNAYTVCCSIRITYNIIVNTWDLKYTGNWIWICSYKKAWWWLWSRNMSPWMCFNNKFDVFDWKNLHFLYIQEHIGMTNVKKFSVCCETPVFKPDHCTWFWNKWLHSTISRLIYLKIHFNIILLFLTKKITRVDCSGCRVSFCN